LDPAVQALAVKQDDSPLRRRYARAVGSVQAVLELLLDEGDDLPGAVANFRVVVAGRLVERVAGRFADLL
jgi:hypothetical protein